MTSVFSADGKNVPCTVIEAGPCVVTQIKSVEKDGYAAVQVGFQDKKEKHTTKPLMGHFKKAGVTPKRHLAEFKDFETELNLGDTITVELFNDAAYVDVVGTSKGKGFQGVVKRHGFGGVGQTTHGQHNRARKPGSIGACSYPAKVFKGMRMGGRICKRDRAAARVCEIEEEGKRKWKTRERRIKDLTEEKRRISTGKIKRKPFVSRKQRAWHRKKESRKRVHHRRNVLIRKNAADAHI